MFSPALKLFSCLLTFNLLVACTTLPNSNSKTERWGISGKIGITTPTETVAGFIEWQQNDEQFDVYVSGPLSIGSARIHGDRASISISQNGKTTSGINPQALIYEQLGWYFPLENLPYWLKGNIAPFSKAKVSKNENGRLNTFEQDQWQVTYSRYNNYYDQPSRIKITQGEWKFLIVIKNWTFDT